MPRTSGGGTRRRGPVPGHAAPVPADRDPLGVTGVHLADRRRRPTPRRPSPTGPVRHPPRPHKGPAGSGDAGGRGAVAGDDVRRVCGSPSTTATTRSSWRTSSRRRRCGCCGGPGCSACMISDTRPGWCARTRCTSPESGPGGRRSRGTGSTLLHVGAVSPRRGSSSGRPHGARNAKSRWATTRNASGRAWSAVTCSRDGRRPRRQQADDQPAATQVNPVLGSGGCYRERRATSLSSTAGHSCAITE